MLDDLDGDKSPYEPAEFDPDSLGPDAPSPSSSTGGGSSEAGVLFWSLVLVANVALMAGSLGLMFAVFQGQWVFGTQLLLAGLIMGVYVYYRVRRFQSE